MKPGQKVVGDGRQESSFHSSDDLFEEQDREIDWATKVANSDKTPAELQQATYNGPEFLDLADSLR